MDRVTARVDAPSWRGVVSTRELWIDVAAIGQDEARRRVLAWWRPGSALRVLGGGWWLSLPDVVRVDTRATPAAPLVRVGSALTSAPGRAPDGVWLLRGGEWRGGPPESCDAVDPSAWLDAALPCETARPRPLGDPPPIEVVAAPIALDLRQRLGFSEAAGKAFADVVAGLPSAPPGMMDGLRGMFAGLLGGAARAGNAIAGSSAVARSWMSRLESLAQSLGLDSLLTSAVGAHNARYLQDLFSRLEGGDWLEAIGRALPLAGEGDGGKGDLAWLSKLQGLRWGAPDAGAGGGGVGLGLDVYERLRALYQRAYDALDAQGRTREAAYVLGQLLGDVAGAVDYLEQKGELQLAAELAEAKKLDPGLVVTLWIRAGDEDRAVALAIVHGAFGAAVEQLERRGDTERATGLRLRWAWREQRAGRVVAAVDIAWPVELARPVVEAWLAAAVAAGGPGGARSLAKSLSLRPEARASDLAALAEMLADERGAPVRLALAASLGDDPLSRRALRETARALLVDHADSPDSALAAAACRAAQASTDGALPADMPSLPAPRTRTWPAERVWHGTSVGDTGTAPVYDAVPLPGGRWLVAAGEAGTWLLDRDGRRIVTFAAPSHRLVHAEDGGRTLLLGRRLDRWRVHQLTWPDRKVQRWTDLAIDDFCASCDGSVWFVARGGAVDALDLQANTLRSLWRVEIGAVLAMEWRPGHLQLLGEAPRGEVEVFRYVLPQLRLDTRGATLRPPRSRVFALSAAGFAAAGPVGVEFLGADFSRLERADVQHLAVRETWVAASVGGAAELYTPDGLGFKPRAVVATTGATATWSRFGQAEGEPPTWVVGDDVGRLRVVDLETGALRQDLRVR